jgi:hypothetical protein
MLTRGVCLLHHKARPHTDHVNRSRCRLLSGTFSAVPPTASISYHVIITCLGSWWHISLGRNLMTTMRPKMRCWGG